MRHGPERGECRGSELEAGRKSLNNKHHLPNITLVSSDIK